MKRNTYTENKIIGMLKEHEAGLLAEGVVRKHGIACSTFHRWKSKYAGMDLSGAKLLKEFESENAKLNQLLAETLLDTAALADVLSKKW